MQEYMLSFFYFELQEVNALFCAHTMKIQKQTDIGSYKPDGMTGRLQQLVRDVVIPYQYDVLCDKASDAEKSHVVQNFINAGKALRGEDTGDGFYGMIFQDSDAAKWLEAAAYSLAVHPDAELEHTADGLIELIEAAQDKDGYLNTFFTVKDREKRWTNLLEAHELYCAGHMMEAACAYYEATGKRTLLDVMVKNAGHIYDIFITQGRAGCPGHPEIELALMKLWRISGDERCLELAKHFVDVRGIEPDYFEKEAQAREWSYWGADGKDRDYMQCSKPVREQSDAVGHAVRAVYLYTAMADIAAETGDETLIESCRRLWQSITCRRMYITGGIGSTVHGEAFSVDYDLPGDTAYAETCASVGLIFFASRMLENELRGEYADVMEQACYNTVLAGMQNDGRHFFYVNPLECIPGISGEAAAHRHVLTQRPKWYSCACCPPNVARLIGSFGKYAYGENADTAYCHLYAAGSVNFENGMKIICKTDYPYGFDVHYSVVTGGRLAVRIPGWSQEFLLEINGIPTEVRPENGYIAINAADGDEIKLAFDDKPYFVYASADVPRLRGYTAIRRGPLVYCFEGADNRGDVIGLSLVRSGKLTVLPFDREFLGGTVKITADAVRIKTSDKLYDTQPPEEERCAAVAVPYYLWCSRGENQMRVWMNEIKDTAR